MFAPGYFPRGYFPGSYFPPDGTVGGNFTVALTGVRATTALGTLSAYQAGHLTKALMYALGGVARGGATRGGYRSPKVFVAINGVQYATARAAGLAQVDAGSLSIMDVRGTTPNTCQFAVRGFTPSVGQSIVITLGSINNLTR